MVRHESWALLLTHYAIRALMYEDPGPPEVRLPAHKVNGIGTKPGAVQPHRHHAYGSQCHRFAARRLA